MRNFDELRQLFIQTDTTFKEGAADVFSQSFRLPAVKKASLTITALGLYEADLNGKRVGDLLLTPGYTYYPRQLQVQVYDVTDVLDEGENELRIFLGQGWYCGRYTYDNKCQIYGEHTAAAWILEAETDEGILRITSRDSSVGTMESPYKYAGIYDGEIYQGGTLRKGTDKVVPYAGKLPEVLEEGILYTKVQEKIPVQSAQKVKDVTILDFGQNFAGFVEIDPTYMDGQELKLRHGEILNSDGSLYTVNLRKAKQEIVYLKGDTEEKYRPRFTFMGFRYVELSGVEYKPGLVTAYAIHSDMKRTGFFSCGNRKVNQLYSNQIWGQKSNYLEVPTDCPQRDERMGYTGDCHVFALTGAYNYDTEVFLSKFLKDIRYTQMDNSEGYVAGVVPALGPEGIGFINMLGWGNAVTILPWMMWQPTTRTPCSSCATSATPSWSPPPRWWRRTPTWPRTCPACWRAGWTWTATSGSRRGMCPSCGRGSPPSSAGTGSSSELTGPLSIWANILALSAGWCRNDTMSRCSLTTPTGSIIWDCDEKAEGPCTAPAKTNNGRKTP